MGGRDVVRYQLKHRRVEVKFIRKEAGCWPIRGSAADCVKTHDRVHPSNVS
jgi:hypothetical protein